MSYGTLDNLKQRLGKDYAKLTDRNAATTANDIVGQEILDGAHGKVDMYLGKRYRTPIDAAGDSVRAQSLTEFVLDVAEFGAWKTNPFRKDIPERVKYPYEQTLKQLRDIAAGKAELPGSSALPSANVSGPTAVSTGDDRIFTQDAMKGL